MKKVTKPLFKHILNVETHPVFKKSIWTILWSVLFLFDFVFEISSRNKNESNLVLKKRENKGFIGRCFKKLHEKNVASLLNNEKKVSFSAPLEIPSVLAEDFNDDLFLAWRKNINKPMVVKGFLKHEKILQMVSDENLIEKHGKKEVVCVGNKNMDTAKEHSSVGQNIRSETTDLESFLTKSKYEEFYINNCSGLFENKDFLLHGRGKELEKMLKRPNVIMHWFISRKRSSGSFVHCAAGINTFMNLKGRKEWFFIHPSFSPILESSMARYGSYCVSEFNETFDGSDFYKNLIEQYPFMSHVPVYRVVLEEGDMLYNPSWWWHRVQNMSSKTVGIAVRFGDVRRSFKNATTFTLAVLTESLKYPKKSVISMGLRSMLDKKNSSKMNNVIFHNKNGDK